MRRRFQRVAKGFSPIDKSSRNVIQRSEPVTHTELEEQAATLVGQGKFLEAESIYRTLITTGTNNHVTYGNLALICWRSGRYGELTELIKQALQLNPSYPEAHNILGIAFQQKGDIDCAIASYNKAISLSQNFADSHNNLGTALQNKGDLINAISAYKKAIKINPTHPEFHNNLGNALKDQGRAEDAAASYIQALNLKPNFPEAHYNLGVVLQEQGNLGQAKISY
jgi:Flp pilus assembly protein TadD